MSYILDALKRSEQEERIRQTPALDAVHVFSSRKSTNPTLMILLLVSLSVATGTAFYLYLSINQQTDSVASTGIVPGDGETLVPAMKPIITKASVDFEPVILNSANESPIAINDLPARIQSRIPEMHFSSHIFAEDPTLRMVNINGKSIREGEKVTDTIRLFEITEEGVVLGYLDYTFEMSVLRDWTFD